MPASLEERDKVKAKRRQQAVQYKADNDFPHNVLPTNPSSIKASDVVQCVVKVD